MRTPWTLYELAKPIGTSETPHHLAEGKFTFRALPFFATNEHATRPKDVPVFNVWKDYDKSRLAILGGLDWAVSQRAHVYQLSLQLLPSPYGADDPLNRALSQLVDEHRVVVVAAGNSGPAQGTLSDLAKIPGVISVGAATPEGRLLDSSSRGSPGGAIPSLVCDGTDPWPEPYPPGTSFAAARVAELCVFLRSVLAWLAREFSAQRQQVSWPPGLPKSSRLAVLDIGFDQEEILRRDDARRSQFAIVDSETYTEYVSGIQRALWMDTILDELTAAGLQFEFDSGPTTIRRILQAAASTVTCTDPTGCGAGFLPENGLFTHLAALTPSRLYNLFGDTSSLSDSQRQLLDSLDRQRGPLWDETTIGFLRHEYLDKADRIYARVL